MDAPSVPDMADLGANGESVLMEFLGMDSDQVAQLRDKKSDLRPVAGSDLHCLHIYGCASLPLRFGSSRDFASDDNAANTFNTIEEATHRHPSGRNGYGGG